MFVNLLSGLQYVKSGRLRVLAVAAPERLAAIPDVPTVAESGVRGYEFQAWIGFVAPAGTPTEIISRLNSELQRVLATDEIQDHLLNKGGLQPVGGTAAQFAAHITSEKDRWRDLVKETGARID